MKRALLQLTLALAFFLGAHAPAANFSYTMKSIYGTVLVWTPWGTEWKPAIAGPVPEGSLLQIGDRSNVDIEVRFVPMSAGPVTQISLKKPIVVRVDENLSRKVTVNSFFISELPKMDADKAASRKAPPLFFNLNESWTRFTALFNSKEDEGKIKGFGAVGAKDQAPAQQAIATKGISLYLPKNHTIAVGRTLPVPIRMTWEKVPDEGVKYEIRVWPEGSDQNTPIAVTTQSEYLAKMENEGAFYFQVASTDGVWQSAVHKVDIAVSNIYAEEKEVNEFNNQTADPSFHLSLPPDEFSYLRQGESSLLIFSWEAPENAFEPHHYEFVLSDNDGKEISRNKLTTRITYLKISDPGNYYWYVEAVPPAPKAGEEAAKTLVSEHRALHVISQSRMTSLRTPDPFDLVDSIIARGTGIYFLDAGL